MLTCWPFIRMRIIWEKTFKRSPRCPNGTTETLHSHSAMEPELAGGLPLCGSRCGLPEGNEGESALCLRQLGGESSESESSAGARQGRQSVQRRNVSSVGCKFCPVNFDPARGDPRMLLQKHWRVITSKRIPQTSKLTTIWRQCCQSKEKNRSPRFTNTQLAVGLRPDDAAANNALGAALVAANHPEQAVQYLRAALKARPDYFDGHYNLGFRAGRAERFCWSGRNSSSRISLAARKMQM